MLTAEHEFHLREITQRLRAEIEREKIVAEAASPSKRSHLLAETSELQNVLARFEAVLKKNVPGDAPLTFH